MTYRGNRKRMAAVAVMALYAALIVPGMETRWGIVAAGCALAVAAGVFAWMWTLRLTLTSQGLSLRSIAQSREIAWTDVERIRWRDRDWVWIHMIPVSPPDRHVLLAMKDGSRLRLGESFRDAVEMINQVIGYTRPHLYRRMLDDLNRGGTLDLGALRIGRMSGVELKTLFGFESIGFDQIDRYGIEEGEFRIWPRGAGKPDVVPAERVANVNALVDVLDAVFHGDRSKPAAFASIHEPSAAA